MRELDRYVVQLGSLVAAARRSGAHVVLVKLPVPSAYARKLPDEETKRRWNITTPQWPIMHAVTYGMSRDQLMARHKANHIQVAYAPDAAAADLALAAKASAFQELGLDVSICGSNNGLVQ